MILVTHLRAPAKIGYCLQQRLVIHYTKSRLYALIISSQKTSQCILLIGILANFALIFWEHFIPPLPYCLGAAYLGCLPRLPPRAVSLGYLRLSPFTQYLPGLPPRATSPGFLPGLPPRVTSLGYLPELAPRATTPGYLPGLPPQATSLGYLPRLPPWATSPGYLLMLVPRNSRI